MLRLVIGLLVLLVPSVAQAEARFALLIGNQGYNAKVGPLKNPHNDIELIGAALRSLGFNVTGIKDADYRSIEAAIKRHVATVRRQGRGTISFVYYSGHGAADPDTKINYLIPVDVANADDEELWNFSLNLNTVVAGLRAQAPDATHYVVFDACRNELNLTRKGQKALTDKGFVPIPYTPGMMVAYATAPGRTASDVGTDGGTYARALAEEIVKPGVDSMLVFTRVARRVKREIGQDPFMSASTMPEVYFALEAVAPPPPRCDDIEALVGNERRCLKPKDSFRDCANCPEMVVVPSGSFTMGSPANEPERHYWEDQVRVSIAAPFAAGKYAVTFEEWDACVADGGCNGYEPADQGWGRAKHPVINVNWHDAKAYAEWLSLKTGKSYRLLSEAEREYVTRAGTTTPFWWGSQVTPKQANYDGSVDAYKGGGSKGEYRKRTVPVDSFEPNPWGFYNVHGNVFEWTEDCWNDSNTGNPGNGTARTTGDCSHRVVRSGPWHLNPRFLRSAFRSTNGASSRYDTGFRLARTLNP